MIIHSAEVGTITETDMENCDLNRHPLVHVYIILIRVENDIMSMHKMTRRNKVNG